MKLNKSETSKSPDPKTPETATPAETPQAAKTPDAKTPETAAPSENLRAKADGKPTKLKNANPEGTRIISVMIPERLARQVKLLCSVTGTTAQALVQSALQKAVNRQLAAAIESIKPDVSE